MINLRGIIAQQFAKIAFDGHSANRVMSQLDHSITDPRNLALARECLFGSARHYEKLDWMLSQLMSKPLKTKEIEIRALLITGLYQLLFLDTAPHAVISESVHATRQLKKSWASGLVNAVLRNAQRKSEQLLQNPQMPAYVKHELPQWLLQKITEAWPEHSARICQYSNQKAPMVLRLNQAHPKATEFEPLLKDANIPFQRHPVIESAIILLRACAVTELPEFETGLFSVQDASAQLAAELLPVVRGDQVLDACAAPGGKTAHLLEKYPETQVIALEVDATRAEKIQQNLTRIGLNCPVIIADATCWQSQYRFDGILLDAPCSATGVIRRQPDIKLHRRPEDIIATAKLQRQLLHHLWQQLKPGGHLLYATCSILPEENQQQIEDFLTTQPNAQLIAFPETYRSLGLDTGFGLQILPSDWHDGFFYSLLQKKAEYD
jgi:16S rRNA (cytosine967-C5)-methyltransferase